MFSNIFLENYEMFLLPYLFFLNYLHILLLFRLYYLDAGFVTIKLNIRQEIPLVPVDLLSGLDFCCLSRRMLLSFF